jgi:hypothetical protein
MQRRLKARTITSCQCTRTGIDADHYSDVRGKLLLFVRCRTLFLSRSGNQLPEVRKHFDQQTF